MPNTDQPNVETDFPSIRPRDISATRNLRSALDHAASNVHIKKPVEITQSRPERDQQATASHMKFIASSLAAVSAQALIAFGYVYKVLIDSVGSTESRGPLTPVLVIGICIIGLGFYYRYSRIENRIREIREDGQKEKSVISQKQVTRQNKYLRERAQELQNKDGDDAESDSSPEKLLKLLEKDEEEQLLRKAEQEQMRLIDKTVALSCIYQSNGRRRAVAGCEYSLAVSIIVFYFWLLSRTVAGEYIQSFLIYTVGLLKALAT